MVPTPSEMTDGEVLLRLGAVSEPYWDGALITDVYGLTLDDSVLKPLKRWLGRPRERPAPPLIHREHYHHLLMESWFQAERVVPLRWAAASVGMTTASFVAMLERGVVLDKLANPVVGQVVPESFVRDLPGYFQGMFGQVFASHSARCRALHAAVRDEWNVEVEPLLCASSQGLGERPVLIAEAFDILTNEPVSLVHKVWLDTRKPIRFAPDICGLKTYARHELVLREHIYRGAGVPEVPQELRAA